MPFNEANVLDAVTRISNYYDLGFRLGVPTKKLDEICAHPMEERLQMFVNALFENVPKEKCNWEGLYGAIKGVEVQRWATRGLLRGNYTPGTSLDAKNGKNHEIENGQNGNDSRLHL